jgi:hypothetical protein
VRFGLLIRAKPRPIQRMKAAVSGSPPRRCLIFSARRSLRSQAPPLWLACAKPQQCDHSSGLGAVSLAEHESVPDAHSQASRAETDDLVGVMPLQRILGEAGNV